MPTTIIDQPKENRNPNSVLVDVSPDLARSWINNTSNYQRAVSSSRVAEYAEMMIRGDWKPTPIQQIGISASGQIVDGQHRCWAVIKVNRPIPMWVCFNCPADIFGVIDRGKNRTKAQIAAMSGCKYSSVNHIGTVNSLAWTISTYGSVNYQWDVEDTQFLLNFYEKQMADVFPRNFSGATQIRAASFRGACLRALISMPDRRKNIIDFVKIVSEGMPICNCSIELQMPLMLRTLLQNIRYADGKDRWSAYFSTLKALNHALKGTAIVHRGNLKVRDAIANQPNPFPIYLDEKPDYVKVCNWLK